MFGAPYVPSRVNDLEKVIKFTKLDKYSRFVDLGCGDGGVLLAVAKTGARVVGYEISPVMYMIAKIRTRKNGLIEVRFGDFLKVDLDEFSHVFVFTAKPFVPKISKKLNDLNAVIVSNGFELELNRPLTKIASYNVYAS